MTLWTRASSLLVLIVMAISPARAQGPDTVLRAHGGPVRALAVMADGQLASASFDSTIILWDVQRGRAAKVLRPHATAINALVADEHGCVVSGGEDGLIKTSCIDSASGAATLRGHTAAVSALTRSPLQSRIVSGSWDRAVRLWGVNGDSRIITEHTGPVTGVAFAQGQTAIVSASHDGTLRLTPLIGDRPSRVLQLETPINALVVGADGKILLAAADGLLREIEADLSTARIVAAFDGPLTALALSAEGSTVAVGGLRTPLTLVERMTGAIKPTPPSPGLPIWTIIFSADGQEIFTGSGDRTVRRFDALTGRPTTPAIPPSAAPETTEVKDRGAQIFRACSACHGLTRDDTNLAGPTLHQIMGRRIASQSAFVFSPALQALDIVWTPATIAKLFEIGPALYTPGTTMPEQRITNADDRAALVAWLARVTVP